MENESEINLNSETAQKIDSISKIVSASAAENQNQSFGHSAKPPKRGPGRPRKDGKPNKASLSRMGLDSDPLDPKPSLEAGSLPGSGDPEPAAQALDIPPELLKPALQMPFNLLRARTGFEGFKLDDSAAADLVPLAQHVLKQYLPETNSPHAPAAMLVGTLGTYLFVQWTEYKAWQADQAARVREAPNSARATNSVGFPAEHVR